MTVLGGEHESREAAVRRRVNGRPRLDQFESARLMTVLAGEDQGGVALGRLLLLVGPRLEQCADDLLVMV